MARILCNLIPGSTSHFRMASPEVFAGDFDITYKFWTRDVIIQMHLGDYAAANSYIGDINGVFRINIAGNVIDSAAGVIEIGKYYTARATRVGTAVTLYLDGVSVATGTSSNTLTLDAVGAYNAGAFPFDGYIADVDTGNYAWALDEATAATEVSTPAGNTITYTNIPAATQRFVFTESAGSEYWWGTNGENLELDVQQPAADVYILAGQSNMVGVAPIGVGVDDVYSTLNGRIMQYGYATQARFGATNPLDHADESGSVMGMWREMCLGLSASNILLIPVADAATGFFDNDWNQGDAVYNAAVTRANAGMLSNSNNTLKGFVWLQGENDAIDNRTEAQYLADLHAMRTAMIADITDMTSATPWVVIEILAALGTWTQINAALATFVTEIPNGTLITTDDLTLLGDNVHYDAASLRTIGTRTSVVLEPAGVGYEYIVQGNDALSTHFSRVAGESLNDAERRWLLSQGATSSGSNQDLWVQFLKGEGYTGSINDMLKKYWLAQ